MANSFRELLRATYGQTMNQNEKSVQILNICERLAYLMPTGQPSRQKLLSLRAAAILINRVARLYKNEVDRLFRDLAASIGLPTDEVPFEDVQSTQEVTSTEEVLYIYEVTSTEEEPYDEEVTANEDVPFTEEVPSTKEVPCNEEVPSTEQVLAAEEVSSTKDILSTEEVPRTEGVQSPTGDLQFTSELPRTRDLLSTDALNEEGPADEDWDEFERICEQITRSDIQTSDLINGSNVNGNQINMSVLKTTTVEETPNTNSGMKNDQAIQTSDHFNADKSNTEERNNQLDRNLPYAIVMIHENYESQIPIRLLFSNINPSFINECMADNI